MPALQNLTIAAGFMKVIPGYESEYLEVEQAEILEKTYVIRDYVSEEVHHLAVGVDNPQAMKYMVIMRNHIPPERSAEYVKMDREIFKPLQEEMIRREALAQWGIWSAWPYKEGQAQVVEINKNRKQVSVEVWELIDYVIPEQ